MLEAAGGRLGGAAMAAAAAVVAAATAVAATVVRGASAPRAGGHTVSREAIGRGRIYCGCTD